MSVDAEGARDVVIDSASGAMRDMRGGERDRTALAWMVMVDLALGECDGFIAGKTSCIQTSNVVHIAAGVMRFAPWIGSSSVEAPT